MDHVEVDILCMMVERKWDAECVCHCCRVTVLDVEVHESDVSVRQGL